MSFNLHVNSDQDPVAASDQVDPVTTSLICHPDSFFVLTSIMLPKFSVEKKLVNKLASLLPAFTDVFDEESFYIFFLFFVLFTIVTAFVLSRYVTIKDAGHVE